MWKVLIVEDEKLMREYVNVFISEQRSDFEVVGMAINGANALEFVSVLQPDLIISDLMMPVMDGVELLRNIRNRGWNTRFLILTCLNEFDSVRNALEQGASNYMLKLSMDEKTLHGALDKIKMELEQMTQNTFKQKTYEFQELYREIWDYLTGRRFGSVDSLIHQVEPPQIYKGLYLLSILHGMPQFSLQHLSSMLPALNLRDIIHSFTYQGHTTFFVWTTTDLEWTALIQTAYSYPYGMVYSPAIHKRQLPIAWSSLLRKLDDYWYGLPHDIIRCSISDKGGLGEFVWEQEREFVEAYGQRNGDACILLMTELRMYLELHHISQFRVKETAERTLLLIGAGQSGGAEELEHAFMCSTHKELFTYLNDRIYARLEERIASEHVMSDHPEINKVILYINRHFTQDISLKVLAKEALIDEEYLSRLFKKKTGENIMHYLQKIRIEHAKTFLSNTKLPVHEIAERIGYKDQSYFIKIFKRWVGITPNGYRNST